MLEGTMRGCVCVFVCCREAIAACPQQQRYHSSAVLVHCAASWPCQAVHTRACASACMPMHNGACQYFAAVDPRLYCAATWGAMRVGMLCLPFLLRRRCSTRLVPGGECRVAMSRWMRQGAIGCGCCWCIQPAAVQSVRQWPHQSPQSHCLICCPCLWTKL